MREFGNFNGCRRFWFRAAVVAADAPSIVPEFDRAAGNLTTYRKKRDFEKTAEPSGEAKVAPSKQLRFVIQKHAATRLHYDFRLELDGIFKSWAVTRGPSLDPHDKRLAVEVEDHPLDYGDFEGTIPKGQYGGGTVLLWDRGYLGTRRSGEEAEEGRPEIHAGRREAARQLGAGADANDSNGGKRTNWLLIKHRDEYAKDGDGEDVLEKDRFGRLGPGDGGRSRKARARRQSRS